MTSTYTIGAPVEAVPPVATPPKRRDDWSACYRAARAAGGRWVPITFPDRVTARSLALAARKYRDLEAESRGSICFLRRVT